MTPLRGSGKVVHLFGGLGRERSALADLTPEARFFVLAVHPQRVRAAASAGFWRGCALGAAFGALGGLWVMTLVLR